jgi:8-oxo-dGTP pyrophosphatase MutT (NUDIX family)
VVSFITTIFLSQSRHCRHHQKLKKKLMKQAALLESTHLISPPKYPGMLDHIVAGGQPYGIAPMENMIKECGEEAGIPRDLAQASRSAEAISYEYSGKTGMEHACLFCYDLELQKDFTPQDVDGEVNEFFLWTLDKVAAMMDPNCQDPY